MKFFKIFLLISVISILTMPFYSCREKKFKQVNKKRTEQRNSRINLIDIYNVNFSSQKNGDIYNVFIDFYVKNKSKKKVYWFQVLVNIFSNGKLTHSIIYTPNYYKKKGSNISYYHVLAPGQVAKMKIILGNSYKIISKPDLVKLVVFDVGDNIEIFKKIRVNPDKYFIPYTPGD